ncbi:hypothetical protein D3C85_1873690 [compost metagenome]
MHAGEDFFVVVDHHPQQQAAVLKLGLHAIDVGVRLGFIEISEETNRRAVLHGIEQQVDKAPAIVGKALGVDPA